MYRYLIFLILIIGCNKNTPRLVNEGPTDEHRLYKEYVLKLDEENTFILTKNEDVIHILSIKNGIDYQSCKIILSDYLNLTKNTRRKFSDDYKIEAIKNLAFEHDITEEQLGNLLFDYLHYINSKNLNY